MEPQPRKMCLHCVLKAACRGLCWTCYYNSSRRLAYSPPDPRASRRGLGRNGQLAPAAKPTGALPGTVRKQAVMRGRLKRGEAIFHPLDAAHAD